MKALIIIMFIPILFIINGCDSLIFEKTETGINKRAELDKIINEYDPRLSSTQHDYRMWISKEDTKGIGVFELNSINDLSIIDNNIRYFLNSKNTVLTYLLQMVTISNEYGTELKSLLRNNESKEIFNSKWRVYQEGIVFVMNYDIEIIVNFLDALNFLKDNFNNYEVDNDSIYFYEEDILIEYSNLIMKISDPGIEIEQLKARSNTVHSFDEALKYVKTELKIDNTKRSKSELPKNDLKEFNLFGNVRSIEIVSYAAIMENGIIVKGNKEQQFPWRNSGYAIFNTNGKKLIEHSYSNEDLPSSTRYFEYNSQGLLISSKLIFSDNILTDQWFYNYDSLDYLVVEKGLDSNDSLEYFKKYEYNSKGFLTIEEFYLPDSILEDKTCYKHNSRGNIIEEIHYNNEGIADKRFLYKYDRKGNETEFFCYDEFNELLRKSKTSYDKFNNIIEYNFTSLLYENNIKTTYEYEYDRLNNWISQIVYIDDVPNFIVEKKIEYY